MFLGNPLFCATRSTVIGSKFLSCCGRGSVYALCRFNPYAAIFCCSGRFERNCIVVSAVIGLRNIFTMFLLPFPVSAKSNLCHYHFIRNCKLQALKEIIHHFTDNLDHNRVLIVYYENIIRISSTAYNFCFEPLFVHVCSKHWRKNAVAVLGICEPTAPLFGVDSTCCR